MKPTLCLVTPALANANNGNWQTAARWARMLSPDYRVRLKDWDGQPDDAMIALHARRSAASIAQWSRQPAVRPLVVALTGTDLYRDIAVDAAAQRSLALADRLVVLNEGWAARLPAPARQGRWCACSPARAAAARQAARHLRALMVGHLRAEKDPQTYFAAARRLAGRADILLDHIGGPLDAALAAQAAALMAQQPRYRWLGAGRTAPRAAHPARPRAGAPQPHGRRRARGDRGGAQRHAGDLASRIDGNVGLLGADYAGGYFDRATPQRWPRCSHAPATIRLCCRPWARNVRAARRCSSRRTSRPACAA
jgi:hypothetical protein